ncbi:hypothetical protein [Streptococcus suis]|uniref:hypothetical protein n=2 Tax=Streptococcus suis TaxID=1307 RepID=UPI0015D4DD00|nr:hypothetical protein [Streptococcus suis]
MSTSGTYKTKSKSKGRKPQPLICSIPPFAKESNDLLVSWFVGPVVCDTADCEVEKEEVRWKGGRMKAKIIFIVSNFNAFALFSCLFFPKVAQEVAITYISLSQLIVIGYLFWDDE